MHGAGSTETAERRRRSFGWRWTIGYYAVLAIVFVVVHQDWLMVDLVGEDNSIWLWKANETYVVAFIVPLFWDVVATLRRNGTIVPHPRDTGGWIARRVAWYGGLLVVLACMEGPMFEAVFGARLPQRVLTLRDVFSGLVVLSLYFDWSRGFWRRSGPRLVSAWARLAFWVAVLLANIAIYQGPVKDLLGPDHASTLDFHAEAFAVCLFVPLYFDIVLPLTRGDAVLAVRGAPGAPGRALVLGCWIVLLAFLTWIGQGTAREWFDNAFGQWFVRSPEPPLAAIAFTFYFEVVRRLDGVRSAGETSTSSDRVSA
ncbi:hypothetical protein SFC88_06340 [Nocardioides sp. HM23]|uniref:hypothetical protein n=1 Tax=Nocardioides bizhenqiangii TaxID=3095076 RepID=UPI002ACA6264|nr:hypothetical protein [Nocardioides sp. HM23]MDZ5620432.1 hypothetical protein [Nocardioides sp. HM23]